MNSYAKETDINGLDINSINNQDIILIIQDGVILEKENMIEEAIKKYEEALSLLELENLYFHAHKLYVKIGDLYQIRGHLADGLKYFQKALESAKMLSDRNFQVDALAKIADSCLSLGEIDSSMNYAKMADSILSEDYIKGRIEFCIYWARTYYIKKQFFKARDICNEALKLCSDEYPFHKGRVLITLVELYKDITSVDEHLELLNQAYECFEKVNYKRGMLGIINNIATVYADKLQDYGKALDYLFKLKELSENSIFIEFNKISYLNIGEAYFKYFKYADAVYWFSEALKNPYGAYIDNILVYNYAFLSLSYLKLHFYHQSYDYFTKASKEVDKNACKESTLVQYYKSAAMLFIELGVTNKANDFIKQALDSVDKDDENITKWNIGLIYEYIRLKDSKKEEDTIEIIEGIKYTISKYKNNEEKLDTIYDVALELINKEYFELAIKLIDDYSFIKCNNDVLKLKKYYIDIKKNEIYGYNNIELLKSTLKLAKEINNTIFHWKLCCSLGDYFVKENETLIAIDYYYEALNIVKELIYSIPEDYRLRYINTSNSLEPLIKIIHSKGQANLFSYDENNTFIKIDTLEQLNDIWNKFNISPSRK